jgi:hypothetical protein
MNWQRIFCVPDALTPCHWIHLHIRLIILFTRSYISTLVTFSTNQLNFCQKSPISSHCCVFSKARVLMLYLQHRSFQNRTDKQSRFGRINNADFNRGKLDCPLFDKNFLEKGRREFLKHQL